MKGYTSVELATAKRLMNRAIRIFGLLAFTGCADHARWVDERDDATCQSYGLSRGDEKYGLCRMMINQQRTQNSLRVYEQGQALQNQNSQMLMQALTQPRNRGFSCYTTFGMTNCN